MSKMNENSNLNQSSQLEGDRYLISLIRDEELDVTKALGFISSPKCGGNSLFLGSTRLVDLYFEAS